MADENGRVLRFLLPLPFPQFIALIGLISGIVGVGIAVTRFSSRVEALELTVGRLERSIDKMQSDYVRIDLYLSEQRALKEQITGMRQDVQETQRLIRKFN